MKRVIWDDIGNNLRLWSVLQVLVYWQQGHFQYSVLCIALLANLERLFPEDIIIVVKGIDIKILWDRESKSNKRPVI